MSYTFGDSELAGDRLALLAEVFRAPSEAFLLAHAPESCGLAIDLGCGPGHTTQLVARVVGANRTVGLDHSAAFLARAAEGAGIEFVQHDVTVVPLPVGAANLIYARFLLAHLPDAEQLVAAWTSQLAPSGRLLLEEVEWIRTDDDVFRDYLAIVDAMIRAEGGDLYLGPRLDALDATNRLSSDVAILEVPPARAARLFRMNLQTWRTNEFIRASVPTAHLDALDRRLSEAFDTSTITWGLRQVAFARL
jgi:SAM-dependent methyltransferase